MSWWSRSGFLLLGMLVGSLLSHWLLITTTPEQLPGAHAADTASAQMLDAGH